ncbi:phage antirepressor KilAC domain-containing protein [Endozoicomonas sp. SM1973]|uniref:Phage antirepressor KilAC domain-containing protein n=1 Tax=Spartinivicinus marinus TaxID=2994442 RepID=A0A853I7Y5_9GAMM|nr:phage antirepressor KilAC domain-containing protein [Spartinivicinus marinus]MCX4027925.1 phage antirepressor KilAC domain-containing protein [Spartinivicinus marinus]NYZ70010.1 phage antirepressor KilAC domain-containing protein [Spartinivicinus marinus]
MNIIPFEFNNSAVRVINKDGEPWFIAKDIAEVLGYAEAYKMTRNLDDDEIAPHIVGTNAGPREFSIINESGLYSAILKSRRPEARIFKKWVTNEVLPTIRKTGSYGTTQIDWTNTQQVAGILAQSMEKIQEQSQQIGAMKPKVEALERIAKSDGGMCITNAAKDLQVRPKDLFSWLSENKWIYRRAGHASWTAYQNKIQQGVLEHKVTVVSRSDGAEKTTEQVRVTPKGLALLAERLNPFEVA